MRERRGDRHSGARDGQDGQVSAPPLTVSRCQNDTISEIIAGAYIPSSMNHGKVVYKKQKRSRGLDVLIYYWDDRDGPELCGWWFGPNVGGDQVWAYHPSRTASTPPASEWNVPHDGPIDNSFSVAMRSASSAVAEGEMASPQQYKKAPPDPPRGRNAREEAPYHRREAKSLSASSPAPEEPPVTAAPPRDVSHAYFVDAYNRRRQERARQEQERHNDRNNDGNGESRRDEPLRRRPRIPERAMEEAPPGRRGHVPEERVVRDERVPEHRAPERRREEAPRQVVRQIQDMKEVMERQAEEERRQVEELKRRADERKKREEEFQRKMQSIMEKPREPIPDKDDRNDRRGNQNRREEREDREREDRSARENRDRDRERDRDAPRDARETRDARDARGDRGERDRDRTDRYVSDRPGYRDRERDQRRDARDGRDGRDGRGERRNDEPGELRRVRRGASEDDERASKRRREDDDYRRPDDFGRRGEEDRRRSRNEDVDPRRDDRPERRKEDDGERKRREEQERIKREEEKRKKEEDMRRREEDLQRKRDEKRRLEDEEKRKVDEERRAKHAEERKRDEERRRQEEERNKEELERKRREEWQRHEEEIQRKAEEEKRRAEEEQQRREEEAKVLRQQQATLAVLRVLQKLSNASPDDFEALNQELQEVLASELPETGQQQEILKAEADRVLEYAKQYVEQVREQQKKYEELKEQQQKKQEELEAAARNAIQELQTLVTSAEAAAEGAHYTAAPLAGDAEMEDVEVLKLCRKVEKTGQSAMTSCQLCTDLLESKKGIIEEAENIKSETSAAVSQVYPRIQAASKLVSDALTRAKDNKDRIAKRRATAKRSEKNAQLFAKYDQDGDGRWNRKEIAAYALGEFNFVMPEENLDRIMRQVCRGEGASADALHLLKISVGIARDEARGQVKREIRLEKERLEREAREEREAELRRRLAEVKAECQDCLEELKKLDPDVEAAEHLTEVMVQEANADQMKEAEEAKTRLKAIESIVQSTHASIAAIRLKAQGLSAKVQEEDQIGEVMGKELQALAAKSELQDLLLRKALSSAEQARQLVLNRAFEKYEAVRMEVAAKLRVCIEVQGGKPDDLYDAIKTAGNKVTKKSIKAYLQANQSLIEDDQIDAVFPGEPLADKEDNIEETEIDREDFMRVVRIFYKVVKEIVLSDNLLIEESDQLRRMDVGEVMEVFQGPMLDPSVGVYRVHGKALKDGIVGWVTVAGNQGITFLMPEGNPARCSVT